MLIGVIADDFTGASDFGNTLAKGVVLEGGLRTALHTRVPNSAAAPDIEAGVVALKSRTSPTEEAVRRQYRPCERGSRGCLGRHIGGLLPAFPAMGRTVYQGHLFVNCTLLSEFGLQAHPLTPLTDPGIRRGLGRQTRQNTGHLPLGVVRTGIDCVKREIDQLGSNGTGGITRFSRSMLAV